MAVDVGVEDTDGQSTRGHRGREVDRDRRLADTALAGRDRVDAGERSRLGEGDDRLGGVAAQRPAQFRALLVVHHVEGHVDGTDTGDVGDGLGHALGDLRAQRAPGGGEVDADGDVSGVVDVDALDHPEFGDGFADLRILHP